MKARLVGIAAFVALAISVIGPAGQASAALAILNGPFNSYEQCEQIREASGYEFTSQCTQRSSGWYFTGYILD